MPFLERSWLDFSMAYLTKHLLVLWDLDYVCTASSEAVVSIEVYYIHSMLPAANFHFLRRKKTSFYGQTDRKNTVFFTTALVVEVDGDDSEKIPNRHLRFRLLGFIPHTMIMTEIMMVVYCTHWKWWYFWALSTSIFICVRKLAFSSLRRMDTDDAFPFHLLIFCLGCSGDVIRHLPLLLLLHNYCISFFLSGIPGLLLEFSSSSFLYSLLLIYNSAGSLLRIQRHR